VLNRRKHQALGTESDGELNMITELGYMVVFSLLSAYFYIDIGSMHIYTKFHSNNDTWFSNSALK